ncbi:hypothetical protein [Enterococcus gallinarum]|uniref:hypothetical protein n=1 Tax=Enterococcus gallinarum TaxID=1353 RepID=UPI003D811F7F
MKSRKQIRKELQRQKRSQLYRKGAATTTALVSSLNLVPVSVLELLLKNRMTRVYKWLNSLR